MTRVYFPEEAANAADFALLRVDSDDPKLAAPRFQHRAQVPLEPELELLGEGLLQLDRGELLARRPAQLRVRLVCLTGELARRVSCVALNGEQARPLNEISWSLRIQ